VGSSWTEKFLFEGRGRQNSTQLEIPRSPSRDLHIASMTKPVTSGRCHDAGSGRASCRWTTRLQVPAGSTHLRVLTKFNEADGHYEARPARTTMTLRHLLTHLWDLLWIPSPVLHLPQGNDKSSGSFPSCTSPGSNGPTPSTRAWVIVETITRESAGSVLPEHIFFRRWEMVDTSLCGSSGEASAARKSLQPCRWSFQRTAVAAPNSNDTNHRPSEVDGGLYSDRGGHGRFMRMLLTADSSAKVRIPDREVGASHGEPGGPRLRVTAQPWAVPRSPSISLGAGRDKFGSRLPDRHAGPDAAKYRRAGRLTCLACST